MLCFRCKLMFENKKNKKKNNPHKPKRPTWPLTPTSSHYPLYSLLASHRIKASRSLNEFRRGSLLGRGLHAFPSCCATQDRGSIGALNDSASQGAAWEQKKKEKILDFFFLIFSL
jgi:hypothetical protein